MTDYWDKFYTTLLQILHNYLIERNCGRVENREGKKLTESLPNNVFLRLNFSHRRIENSKFWIREFLWLFWIPLKKIFFFFSILFLLQSPDFPLSSQFHYVPLEATNPRNSFPVEPKEWGRKSNSTLGSLRRLWDRSKSSRFLCLLQDVHRSGTSSWL